MSSTGTKVTNDPQGINNPKVEKAGTITSDSLAGESLSQGGSFGAGSHAAASQQPSSSTTTNNTDISGATTLQAASDAEARQALEGWNEEAQLNAARGLSSDHGSRAAPPPTSSYLANGPANTSGTAGQAPHGKNISEGGFDSNAPNASFNNDIGGKNDPGRAALNDMQRNAQQSAGDAGIPKQGGVSNDGQFDALKDTSA
ncbi:hypothetical protein D6D02_03558 [Aureobasidium pullulans]|uniref:Uncharacterized protein n=1 Tax=Aureobasidium pullulans TaxID=5580 RepID=A0A4S9JIY6_AURPU|nr:hypothetical protein D6D26_05452 [Aureobasidium pullulans]THW18667.1 hypothetical protein D6D24_03230 [Aureobasidium pullulans]THW28533.1 hypothetical protein D6D23_01871 [Aureobasidium pullulans]THX02923.1 hypothetical protein D6D18_03901 [Aureobasidium pullulans]THY01628.1 hypothetical protein D6D03_05625 [Aureobasidium pullulans]